MESNELKPRSFRLDDETANKIKEISASIGSSNQQETLSKLIEAYEFQTGKERLAGKKEEIEKFEMYVTILTRMYMDSLENSTNAHDAVYAEFEAQLKSKDTIIQDLQAKLSDLKKEKETAENISKKYTTENETLSQQLKEKEEELLKQKEALTTQYEDKKALNDSLKESNKSLKEEIERLKNENKTLSLNIDQLNQSQSEFDVKLQGKESVITDLTKESFDKDNLIQKLNEQVAKLKMPKLTQDLCRKTSIPKFINKKESEAAKILGFTSFQLKQLRQNNAGLNELERYKKILQNDPNALYENCRIL